MSIYTTNKKSGFTHYGKAGILMPEAPGLGLEPRT